jgi:LysR family glycine cleavage system transcriptional activator
MRRLPPLNAVRAFEAAARHLNFNRAAEELHVTPSAVSHQIRGLEEFLGVPLFRREGRQVALTPEAENYLLAVREGLERIAAATERLTAAQAAGVLTLSVAPSFATPWLVPRLAAFQLAHPAIEVRLISALDLVDFTRSDVDAAIRYGLGKWPGLRSHRLFAEELVPVASPALRDGSPPLRRPEDLRQATLLHVLWRLGQWRMWLGVAGVSGIDAERGPKFQTTPLALEAAMAGQGVAIADPRLVAENLKSGRLVTLFDVVLPSESAYYFVYPETRADSPAIAAFRDWLLAEVAASAREGGLTPADSV